MKYKLFEQVTVKLVEIINFPVRELDHKSIHNSLSVDINIIQEIGSRKFHVIKEILSDAFLVLYSSTSQLMNL